MHRVRGMLGLCGKHPLLEIRFSHAGEAQRGLKLLEQVLKAQRRILGGEHKEIFLR